MEHFMGGEKVMPARARVESDAFSMWLDFFRWTAALLVVIDHVQNRFLVRIPDIPFNNRTAALYAFAFFSGFAHQAVMVFFVLSGFLVGGGLWRELQATGAIDLLSYVAKRVSRLCIVLYPALIVMVILNSVGIYYFKGIGNGTYFPDILARMSPATFTCNVLFLQTAACSEFGGNTALWSLFNEFWYYSIWPLVLLGLWAARGWEKRASLLLLAGVMLVVLSTAQEVGSVSLGPYMLIWLLGVGVAAFRNPIRRFCSTRFMALVFMMDLLAARILFRRTFWDNHPARVFGADMLMAILFAMLLMSMKESSTLPRPIARQWNAKLAAFSFSLYCIHVPVLVFYGAAIKHYFGDRFESRISGIPSQELSVLHMVPTGMIEWSIVFGGIALSVAFAFVFSLATEAHNAKLRRWLLALIKRRVTPRIIENCRVS